MNKSSPDNSKEHGIIVWFRFYTEVLDDPKVQQLPPELFRAWVNLLCIAKKHAGILPSADACAFAMRMDIEAFHETFSALHEAKLIDSGVGRDKHNEPHNWRKRQYKSDSSTERVKRYRKRSKAVTETPPETETEAETEAEEERVEAAQARPPPKEPEERKNAKRKRGTRLPADWCLSADDIAFGIAEGLARELVNTEAAKFRDYWLAKSGQGATKLDWPATWRNWVRNCHISKSAGRGAANSSADSKGRGVEKATAALERLSG